MDIRNSILECNDRKIEKVSTPEWPCGHVFVRTLSAADHAAMLSRGGENQKSNRHGADIGNLAAAIICDENGERIFNDNDATELANKNIHALNRIASAYAKLNGLSEQDAIEKNSLAPQD